LENSKAAFERCWQWYLSGPRQRLQPGGAILVVMTRLGQLDLTGRLYKQSLEDVDGELRELLELPAILPSGAALWPEFWPLEEMLRTKAKISVAAWNGQYMQKPADEGALIKCEWWCDWPLNKPPSLKYIVRAWDTAYSEKADADRSAMVTWGQFENSRTPSTSISGSEASSCWMFGPVASIFLN